MVDLPAPFSPISAVTCARMERQMAHRAAPARRESSWRRRRGRGGDRPARLDAPRGDLPWILPRSSRDAGAGLDAGHDADGAAAHAGPRITIIRSEDLGELLDVGLVEGEGLAHAASPFSATVVSPFVPI